MKNGADKNQLQKILEAARWSFKHGLAELSPAKRRARNQWLKKEGIEFLGKIGINPGDTVVDFGCGTGPYSLPAAILVGDKGLVVAVDMHARALRILKRRADAAGLRNIRTAQNAGELPRVLDGRMCDAILLYDVLHFMDKETRRALYASFRGILNPDGTLSVHPTHVKEDMFPTRHFRDMSAEDVVREIEETGFALKERKTIEILHDSSRIPGRIFVFETNKNQEKINT